MRQFAAGEEVALAFAQALSAGNFATAYGYLSSQLRTTTSASRLKWRYRAMVFLPTLMGRKASHIDLTTTLEDWPAKEKGDIGWFYVSITDNVSWAEAVTLVVCQESGKVVIRDIEWGRP